MTSCRAGRTRCWSSRYGYNGLHWRVWRIADEDLDVDSLPDVANLYYYDAMWRLLEEHARGDFGPSEDEWSEVRPDSGDLLKITQRFWCLHYIDDLVAWQTRPTSPRRRRGGLRRRAAARRRDRDRLAKRVQ